MRREILIRHNPFTELAVYEDGTLYEYQRENEVNDAETIYIGRVERIVKGMNAAFIDIGEEKNGFLPLNEKSQSFSSTALQNGKAVLVQVKREAHGEKGAFLSRDITLCGLYVIFMPMNHYIGISAQIKGTRREQLAQLGHRVCGDRFGVVMRSAAATAENEQIVDEIDELNSQWETIKNASATAHVPSIIKEKQTLLKQVMNDYRARGGVQRIVTDLPENDINIETSELPQKAFDYIHRDLEDAFKRSVPISGGGNLVIDQCEAMTVIDVNTAAYTGSQSISRTALEINLRACKEIIRQLRLRSIGGIVIIDFIDMTSDDDRSAVIAQLEKEIDKDRVKCVIHGFTSLGLLEMTRKRSRKSLLEDMTDSCGQCKGYGRVRHIGEEKNG